MNDAEAAMQRARVEALHEQWVKPLGLAWWYWKHVWHRGAIEGHEGALFAITVRFEYHEVILNVCLPRVEKQNDRDLERYFCHELGHVFTIPLKDAAARQVDRDAMHMLEEHQASAIGEALQWLRAHVEQQSAPRLSDMLRPAFGSGV